MKICQDVMTAEPVCCLPEETTEKAAQLMKLEDIGCIPVIRDRESNKLIGIVTDRDLALEVVALGLPPSQTKIEQVMKTEPFCCLVTDDVQKALDKMADHQVRRIPVVDADNRIVGIIAQGDVATRLNDPEKTGEVVAEISK